MRGDPPGVTGRIFHAARASVLFVFHLAERLAARVNRLFVDGVGILDVQHDAGV